MERSVFKKFRCDSGLLELQDASGMKSVLNQSAFNLMYDSCLWTFC